MSATQHFSHLLQVGEEVLLEICDAVRAPISSREQTKTGRDLDSLKAFSRCNRRLRGILADDVLRNIAMPKARDWAHAAEHLESIARNDDVPRYTKRFVSTFTAATSRLTRPQMSPCRRCS